MSAQRIYDAEVLTKISDLFVAVKDMVFEFEGDDDTEPLSIYILDITVRHKDGYTVARIGIDDFVYLEVGE